MSIINLFTMNISIFLRKHRTNNLFATVKEQYINLGGQKALGISLRHFQQIASGDRLPTEIVLDKLFRQIERKDRRDLLLSYFRSKTSEQSRGGIVQYLEGHLADSTPDRKGIWDSNKPQMFLAKEQIDFLIENPPVLKSYFLLSLKNRIPVAEFELDEFSIQKMVDLDLVSVHDGMITPSKELLRIPTFETASPNMAESGTNLILKCLDVFLKKRGSPEQKTLFSLQFVPREVADIIQSQIDHIRTLIRAHATDIDESGLDQLPILFSTFFMILSDPEVNNDRPKSR